MEEFCWESKDSNSILPLLRWSLHSKFRKNFSSLSWVLHSILKTDCVAIMTKIVEDKPDLRFKLCIVCPNAPNSSCDKKYIPFGASKTDTETLKCKCGEKVDVTENLWVKAAYRASRKSASHSEGKECLVTQLDVVYPLTHLIIMFWRLYWLRLILFFCRSYSSK